MFFENTLRFELKRHLAKSLKILQLNTIFEPKLVFHYSVFLCFQMASSISSKATTEEWKEEDACQPKRLLCEMNHRLSWEMDASTLALIATLAIVQHSRHDAIDIIDIGDTHSKSHQLMKAARTGRLLKNHHQCQQLC